MRTTALVCAALAGSFGFSSIAAAQDWRRDRDHDRFEQRQERREDRQERRADRQDRREDRAYRQGYRAGVQQPAYVYQQPSYAYSQPAYRSHAPRFQRGGYLPHAYRGHGYHVGNWNAHPSLYAPPHGHQWVNVGGEFLLVALATGLIANAILN